jgi:hypothetical protein
MQTCQHCKTKFTARIGAKPQVYCSASCRRAVQNLRARAGRSAAEQRTQASGATLAGSNVLRLVLPASAPPQSGPEPALNFEWLSVFHDLERCVAGRQNPAPKDGKSTPREFAVGMDRPPLGHAVMIDGEWIGKVRSRGAVVWQSPRLGSLEAAKVAVENQLRGRPEIVSAAANLNRQPAPLAIAA